MELALDGATLDFMLICDVHGLLALQVEEIALLNTTLRKANGAILLYPNTAVAAAGVCNLSRSGFHTDSVKVCTLRAATHCHNFWGSGYQPTDLACDRFSATSRSAALWSARLRADARLALNPGWRGGSLECGAEARRF